MTERRRLCYAQTGKPDLVLRNYVGSDLETPLKNLLTDLELDFLLELYRVPLKKLPHDVIVTTLFCCAYSFNKLTHVTPGSIFVRRRLSIQILRRTKIDLR